MSTDIAIVGLACEYPDAHSPSELWENVLAQRRAFRRIPAERLRAEDYFSPDPSAEDRTYAFEAAVIEGFTFDRVRFRVAGSTYRATDLAHWLALDVAARALDDAGFPDGSGLPIEMTGVVVGNTLTGDLTRANTLRLRWPYVRRVLDAALRDEGRSAAERATLLARAEALFKAPFPGIDEESLAGGLSNTIAGRICNYFNLKGGGYTVDGACASSLLAVTAACSALAAGDLDVVLAGGVDVSLDPFELVGFAKAGALAADEMRVYDANSAGFCPGEGCGFVVLMRHDRARAEGRRVYAVIRGWGSSSDGNGGITRPEADGQFLALERAYRRAGFDAGSVAYFEGHGTGTAVGDATELAVLARARGTVQAGPPAVVGSVKANIGHTKAAAGVAGLIKATLAIQTQILPPTTGCETPHSVLREGTPALRVLTQAEPWPADQPLRAGVSSMGFGGINAHVVIEGNDRAGERALSPYEQTLNASAQDAELFLLGGRDADDLARQLATLAGFAPDLSRSELGDLAAHLADTLAAHAVRAALVASRASELAERIETLRGWLRAGVRQPLCIGGYVALGAGSGPARIGLLFPGQGSPSHLDGGSLRRRFAVARDHYQHADLPTDADGVSTVVAQPAIVTATVAALRVLEQIGVTAQVAVGHSLGELVALHWAGALDRLTLLNLARARGQAMGTLGSPTGAMASIGAGPEIVNALIGEHQQVVLAGLNARHQTVVSGEAASVALVIERAQARGLAAVRLPVSHAFHSPLVAAAVPDLADVLSRAEIRPLCRTVVSTVTGAVLGPNCDLRDLLVRQVTAPVRFVEAVEAASAHADLFLEVGPGRVLGGLVTDIVETPTVSTNVAGRSLVGLLQAVGAAFALGAPIRPSALFDDRFTRPFDPSQKPTFFSSPCERAPLPESDESIVRDTPLPTLADRRETANGVSETPSGCPPVEGAPAELRPLDVLRLLVAERAELPLEAVRDDSRLLADLHLSSIAVAQLVAEAARRLGSPVPVAPTELANATVADAARSLEEIARQGHAEQADSLVGVESWFRAFAVELVERPLSPRVPRPSSGSWQLFAPSDHPLAESIQQALAADAGSGVLVCLPQDPDERQVRLLLDAAHAALEMREATRFVVVQHGGGAAGFAKTLHLESPTTTVCVIDVPADQMEAVEWIVAEVQGARGYVEAHYDASGVRRVPVLRLLPPEDRPPALPLGSDDVVLVTGGGKGITAECALSLARETGAHLAILGRSDPAADPELAANLERMRDAGVSAQYLAADVTDAMAVRQAVQTAEASLGPVTAIVYGAGANAPALIGSLDEAQVRETLAAKVAGARNVLAAVDLGRVRLFVTFGSIIARTGLPGEAHYALANDWLADLTERIAREHPACRCLALEWSVWSGVGMGARLSRLDALMRAGITPIPPDIGVRLLRDLIGQASSAVRVVVSGRFGRLPTLPMDDSELPFLRFLERPRLHYPGIELIADAEISPDTDPYLDDHMLGVDRLLPAVIGLEMMAQAARALAGAGGTLAFEQVQFSRSIVVPERSPLTVRIAALAREAGQVEVVLRSQETRFQVDHFRAVCTILGARASAPLQVAAVACPERSQGMAGLLSAVPLVPERDLYGGILFHRGRFQRLRAYRRLRAAECEAEIGEPDNSPWFGGYLPQTLVLGDAGARDAAIHAIQACLPHRTLVPIGVERLVADTSGAGGPRIVRARERSRAGDTFVYDLEILSPAGVVLESWQGLTLRAVGTAGPRDAWAVPLLGPYVERMVGELVPGAVLSAHVEPCDGRERRARSNGALYQALGRKVPIQRRPDGKPEPMSNGACQVSAAHGAGLVLSVAGPGPLGCDVEAITRHEPQVWHDLIGPERLALADVVAAEAGEDPDTAATRVWAAGECLRKAGAPFGAPLVLTSKADDGWVMLGSGRQAIATYVGALRDTPERMALAVLVGRDDACL